MAKCTCKKGTAKKCINCKPKKTGMRATSKKLTPKPTGMRATSRKLKRKPTATGMRSISRRIKPTKKKY